MSLRFALAGNPNCGKTTLFNQLTGSRAHVGNWPGVTVERKEGKYNKSSEDITIIDLPGIYSLSPYSEEEIVSRDYLLNEKPDIIINIVDATNFERNIYLTSQLMEIGVPIILALNMMDEVKARGDNIDIEKISSRLGIDVIPITASKGQGITELINSAINIVKSKTRIYKTILANTEVYNVINKVHKTLNENYINISLFSIVKIIERDEKILENYNLNKNVYNKINEIISESEKEFNVDWEITIGDYRYKYITEMSKECIKRKRKQGEFTTSDKIDMIVTNKYLAIPIFFFVMFLIFQITFGAFGSFLSDKMDLLVNGFLSNGINDFLINVGASKWAVGLVTDGIISGIGMVLVFLPQILLLFLFLSILEDTGYMSRAAFIMDRLLIKFGLSGKSFVPMLMGFGCSVPAIMAARTLENEKSKRMTIILTPFMSCGARMPVYAIFAGALFAKNKGIVILSLYLLGIIVAMFCGILLKHTVLKGETATFIMELPTYRIPSFKSVVIHMWEKAKDFIIRVFTILLAASIIIWFLQTFDLSFNMVDDNSKSIFGIMGAFIAPIFKPLGFGDWRAVVALLTGIAAKEAIVSTLGILYSVGETVNSNTSLISAIQNNFTAASAYSYMVFVLLYMPCIAAFAAIKKEMNSWKWTIFTVSFQTVIAWLVSFLVYNIINLFLL